ncbi:hypothetical protein RB195_003425 [Necator americanus]|uniref:Uncharacterized protein n=1 Tax=Necator americanus TaxID=51031 RepID=A0ABR1DQ14_NECAM
MIIERSLWGGRRVAPPSKKAAERRVLHNLLVCRTDALRNVERYHQFDGAMTRTRRKSQNQAKGYGGFFPNASILHLENIRSSATNTPSMPE